MSDKKARHFHAGKLRKEIDGVEYVEVAESNGLVYVAADGTFISRNHQWKPYRGGVARDGYRHVYIAGRHYTAARVVYEVLVGQIPDELEIDHINTERGDNRLENLRIVTHRENLLNPLTRPRRSVACAKNGMLSVKAQGHEKIMKAMRIGWECWKRPVVATKDGVSYMFPSGRDAAEALHLTPQAICHALKGRVRKCGGYTWTYGERPCRKEAANV